MRSSQYSHAPTARFLPRIAAHRTPGHPCHPWLASWLRREATLWGDQLIDGVPRLAGAERPGERLLRFGEPTHEEPGRQLLLERAAQYEPRLTVHVERDGLLAVRHR